MDVERLRRLCLSFPKATEEVQWGDDLLFKIGGKMFAVAPLEPGPNWISFKCSPETFAELVERPGVIPAPYLARAYWVALETHNAIAPKELNAILRQAYDLVFAKLPKKTQAELKA